MGRFPGTVPRARQSRLTRSGNRLGETTHWTGVLMREGGRAQRQFGSAHLARPWSATAPDAPVQAVQRPALRRQIT